MLLEELSRNKKAGLIILALGVIYVISKNFLFRTILGRLLLVLGLVATTNFNKALGLGLVILICLACSQMTNDFENMDNMNTSKTMTPSSSTTTNTTTSNTTTPKFTSGSNSSSNTTNSTTNSTTTNPTTTSMSSGQDIATLAENLRKMATGNNSNSLPTPPKTSSTDVSPTTSVSGTTGKKESFLNYSSYNQ